MEVEQSESLVTGVPKQVFERFLTELEEKHVATDVVARLRKTLVDQGSISESAIKKALFGDNGTDI